MKDIRDIISYEKIIEMAKAIEESQVFDSKYLTIIYELPKEAHYKLDEDLYYRGNQEIPFEHSEIIEVEIGDIVFKFIEEGKKFTIKH